MMWRTEPWHHRDDDARLTSSLSAIAAASTASPPWPSSQFLHPTPPPPPRPYTSLMDSHHDLVDRSYAYSHHHYDPFSIKHRRRTTPPQLAILERQYDADPRPDLDRRKELAIELDMTPREVQVWFQNRRAKAKKMAYRGPNSAPDPPPQDSPSFESPSVSFPPPPPRFRPPPLSTSMPLPPAPPMVHTLPPAPPSRRPPHLNLGCSSHSYSPPLSSSDQGSHSTAFTGDLRATTASFGTAFATSDVPPLDLETPLEPECLPRDPLMGQGSSTQSMGWPAEPQPWANVAPVGGQYDHTLHLHPPHQQGSDSAQGMYDVSPPHSSPDGVFDVDGQSIGRPPSSSATSYDSPFPPGVPPGFDPSRRKSCPADLLTIGNISYPPAHYPPVQYAGVGDYATSTYQSNGSHDGWHSNPALLPTSTTLSDWGTVTQAPPSAPLSINVTSSLYDSSSYAHPNSSNMWANSEFESLGPRRYSEAAVDQARYLKPGPYSNYAQPLYQQANLNERGDWYSSSRHGPSDTHLVPLEQIEESNGEQGEHLTRKRRRIESEGEAFDDINQALAAFPGGSALPAPKRIMQQQPPSGLLSTVTKVWTRHTETSLNRHDCTKCGEPIGMVTLPQGSSSSSRSSEGVESRQAGERCHSSSLIPTVRNLETSGVGMI